MSTRFSYNSDRSLGHIKSITIQEFDYHAKNMQNKNSLYSLVNGLSINEKTDMSIDNDIFLNVRGIKKIPHAIIFFVTFCNHRSQLPTTPTTQKTKSDPIELQDIYRKNEAELFIAVRRNKIYAGITVARISSLKNYIGVFFEKIGIPDFKTKLEATPNFNIHKKIRDDGGIKAVSLGTQISQATFSKLMVDQPWFNKIFKNSSNKNVAAGVSGDFLLHSDSTPEIEDISLWSKKDIDKLLADENYIVTKNNNKIWKNELLTRSYYYTTPLGDDSIYMEASFDILKDHLSKHP